MYIQKSNRVQAGRGGITAPLAKPETTSLLKSYTCFNLQSLKLVRIQ